MDITPVTNQIRKMIPVKYCGAVIVAAGSASRMEGIDKVMAPLKGEPMIVHTVRAFQECPAIREIVVVTRPDLLKKVMNLCAGFSKLTCVVAGGKDRPESVWLGLSALSKKVKLAAIHDGARPLISGKLIDDTVRAAHSYGAAAPGIPVKDTVKVCGGGVVKSTPDRSTLYAIQTPQVFQYDLIRAALSRATAEKAVITDDCSAVERMGFTVKLVAGEEKNLKVTTPLDLKIAEHFMEETL